MATQEEINALLIQAIKNSDVSEVSDLLSGNHPNPGDPPADPDSRDTDNKTALMVSAITSHDNQALITNSLISSGADVDLTDSVKGRTAMHWTAVGNKYATAQELKDGGYTTLDRLDDDGNTELHVCCIYDANNVAEFLLDTEEWASPPNPSDIEYVNTDGHTPLLACAKNDSSFTVPVLSSAGADVDAVDDNGYNAILIAAVNDSKNVINPLVTAGVDLNATGDGYYVDQTNIVNGTLWNALWVASYLNNDNAIDGLISEGMNANSIDDNHPISETVLMFASRYGKSDSVQALLDNGALITKRDDVGQNALIVGIKSLNETVIGILINYNGSPIDVADKSGVTPLMVASELGILSAVTGLVGKDVSLTAKDSSGKTALMYASANGNLSVVQYLVETAQAPLESRDLSDNTALLHAANLDGKGYKEVVDYLIGQGANVNASNNRYQTALMWAAKKNYTDTIASLIENGADLSIQDNNQWTALKWAKEWSNTEAYNAIATVRNPEAEIHVKQDTTDLLSGEGIYNFNPTTVDTDGDEITFTIENLGTATLTISNIYLRKEVSTYNYDTGQNDITYEVTTNFVLDSTGMATSIVYGGSTTFSVQFTPKETGTVNGVIFIASNDVDENTYTFKCLGIGE